MTRPAAGTPVETRWEGRFITVKQQGNWEYVSRSRGIHAAVILAIDEDADGRPSLPRCANSKRKRATARPTG